jgi:hypothetical protein
LQFHEDFEPLQALLNRDLLGDAEAHEALSLSVPGLGLTAVMLAAAGDKPEIVRRLLAQDAPATAAAKIVNTKDATGKNAIQHACSLGRASALDAALRIVQSGLAGRWSPMGSDKAALTDIGLTVQLVLTYSAAIQQQLKAFVADPERYAKQYVVFAGNTAPIAPPAPALPGFRGGPANPAALAQAQAMMLQGMFASIQQMMFAAPRGAAAAPLTAPLPPPSALMGGGGYSGSNNTGSGGGRGGSSGGRGGRGGRGGGNQQQRPGSAAAPARTLASAASLNNDSADGGDQWVTANKGGKKQQQQSQRGGRAGRGGRGGGNGSATAHVPSNVSADAAAGKLAGRKLKAFVTDDAADETIEGEALEAESGSGSGGAGKGKGGGKGDKGGKWDQFAVNKAKFNVQDTYDPSLYTSKLDMQTFTPEQIAAAEALAASIEAGAMDNGAASNPHVAEERGLSVAAHEGMDEEAKYSQVLPAKGGKGGKDAFTDAGIAGKIAATSGGKKK